MPSIGLRNVRPQLFVELLRLSQHVELVEDWRSLATRSLEPNIFFEPGFALAATEAYHVKVIALVVWSSGAPRRLLGFFFPFGVLRGHPSLLCPVLQVWHPPGAAVGTPLIDRESGETVLNAMFDYITNSPALPNVIPFPYLAEERPFLMLMRSVIAARGDQAAMYGRYQRAAATR